MSKFEFTRKSLSLSNGRVFDYYSLPALEESGVGDLSRVPKSVKIL